MTRKRFSADDLSRSAEQALDADRSSPPTREVSLTDVVRALAPRIKERRDAGYSFPRIATWLTGLGYELSAATLCVYWHRIGGDVAEDGVRTASVGIATNPPRAPPPPPQPAPTATPPSGPVTAQPDLPGSAVTSPPSTRTGHGRLRRDV